MSRDTLHDLVDRIPEDELPAAKRFLEYLAVNPACRAALSRLRKATRLRSLVRVKKSGPEE